MELQDSVFDIKTKVDQFIRELPMPSIKLEENIMVEAHASTHLEAPAAAEPSRQFGHHEEFCHQTRLLQPAATSGQRCWSFLCFHSSSFTGF